MKKLMIMATILLFSTASIPVPASADIVKNQDGSFELSEIIISEVASASGVISNTTCKSTNGDFIEIYASLDANLADYKLLAKKSDGSQKEIELPKIELSAGTTATTGCANNSDNYKDINLTQVGEVWLIKNEIIIDHVTYDSMSASESRQRDICLDEMVLVSSITPGSFSADIECESTVTPPQYCGYLVISEIDANAKWVEIHNSYPDYIYPENLEDCQLMIQSGATKTDLATGLEQRNYQTDTYDLSGYGEIAPGEYFVINILADSKMTMASSSGTKDRAVIIRDATTLHSMGIYNSHKSETSWIFENDAWRLTYVTTENSKNIYQKWQDCEVGQHINEATGNCVKNPEPLTECADGYFRNPATGRCKKNPEPKILAECPEGQFRNPATGRCKKYPEARVLAECPEGQYRNPLTNRCKKIATDDDLTPCPEGYERNPETNRCRKIKSSEAAEYAIDPVGSSSENRTWAVIGAAGLGAIGLLIALQFRHEIARGFSKIIKRFKK